MTVTPTTPGSPPTGRRRAARQDNTRPRPVRRRDGVALVATGRVPDRVRALVLAEHRAELAARSRDQITRHVHAGLHPMAVAYGYRPQLAGRVAPRRWLLDHRAATTVRLAAFWAREGLTPQDIAARLAADPLSHPRPLTPRGSGRAWTAHTVRTALGDPALTGHSVWGRTRHGRPVPPEQWVVSTRTTHPEILAVAIWQATRRALDTAPGPRTTPTVTTTGAATGTGPARSRPVDPGRRGDHRPIETDPAHHTARNPLPAPAARRTAHPDATRATHRPRPTTRPGADPSSPRHPPPAAPRPARADTHATRPARHSRHHRDEHRKQCDR